MRLPFFGARHPSEGAREPKDGVLEPSQRLPNGVLTSPANPPALAENPSMCPISKAAAADKIVRSAYPTQNMVHMIDNLRSGRADIRALIPATRDQDGKTVNYVDVLRHIWPFSIYHREDHRAFASLLEERHLQGEYLRTS